MKEDRMEDGENIRHTASLANWDFYAYKEWAATMARERRIWHSFLGFTWDTWEKDGDPIPFTLEFQDSDGNPILVTPEIRHESGYHSERVWVAFTGSPPAGETVNRISSARMRYEFQGKPRELVEGTNWITRGVMIAILLIFLVVVAIIIASG